MPERVLDEIIAGLGSAEKAALRLLIDLPGPTLSPEIEKSFSEIPWTGVILFSKNIEDRPSLQSLIAKLQAMNAKRFPDAPLLVAVDQEGGSVSPLEGFVSPSPGNMALAASGDLEGTYQLSRQIGRELRTLGFNVNFAPVLDVNSNPRNPIIGIRAFGEVPERVADFGRKMIQGYQEEGVLATAKHFPGHGDTSKDSHLELPVVDRSRDTLEKIDFFPFSQAVAAGVGGVMTAHVIYPGLDSKPATLSHAILTDLLREQIKFQGLIFTDSFDMAAIKQHFELEEAVIESIKAGADILLSLGNAKTQFQTFEIIKKAIDKQILTDEEIVPSLRRILSTRKRLGDFKPPASFPFKSQIVEELHAKSVTVLNGQERLPFTKAASVLLTPEATAHVELFRKHFPGYAFIPWPWPSSLPEPTQQYTLFLAERRLLSQEAQIALPRFAPQLECAVAFGNPYLLSKIPDVPIRITTYHCNELLAEHAYRVLAKGEGTRGKLPVTL